MGWFIFIKMLRYRIILMQNYCSKKWNPLFWLGNIVKLSLILNENESLVCLKQLAEKLYHPPNSNLKCGVATARDDTSSMKCMFGSNDLCLHHFCIIFYSVLGLIVICHQTLPALRQYSNTINIYYQLTLNNYPKSTRPHDTPIVNGPCTINA